MQAPALFTLALLALASAQVTITPDWATTLRPLQTVAAFQTVVNPVTQRESPYHDAVYQKIADLGAPYQRYGVCVGAPALSTLCVGPQVPSLPP